MAAVCKMKRSPAYNWLCHDVSPSSLTSLLDLCKFGKFCKIICIQLPVLGFCQVEFINGIYTTHLLAASRIILIITTGDTCLQ